MANVYNWQWDEPSDQMTLYRLNTSFADARIMMQVDKDTGRLSLGDNTLGQGTVRLHQSGVSADYVDVTVPATVGTSYTLTLPADAATAAGEMLVSTGANGTLEFGSKPKLWLQYGLVGGIGTSAGFLNTMDGAQNDDGYVVPSAVTPTAISVQFKVSSLTSGPHTVTLELWVNGTNSGQSVVVSGINANGSFGGSGVVTHSALTAGDTVTLKMFKTVSAGTMDVDNVAATVEFEY